MAETPKPEPGPTPPDPFIGPMPNPVLESPVPQPGPDPYNFGGLPANPALGYAPWSFQTDPRAPDGGCGPGQCCIVGPLGTGLHRTLSQLGSHPDAPKNQNGSSVPTPSGTAANLTINGIIVAGGALSNATIAAVNAAAVKTPSQWRRYIAYQGEVKVGGSLAWRANNPGNLRDAPTKIGSVSGAVGNFAVFATLDDGRAAQKALYLNRYGAMTVRDAIKKLTPSSENDTTKYLTDLQKAGIDLDQDVKSQIDLLMTAVAANEGLITGLVVPRSP